MRSSGFWSLSGSGRECRGCDVTNVEVITEGFLICIIVSFTGCEFISTRPCIYKLVNMMEPDPARHFLRISTTADPVRAATNCGCRGESFRTATQRALLDFFLVYTTRTGRPLQETLRSLEKTVYLEGLPLVRASAGRVWIRAGRQGCLPRPLGLPLRGTNRGTGF